MRKFFNTFLLTTALAVPLTLSAQVAGKVYTDSHHHDSHQWNSEEDQRYREYLKEHHRKYRDFSKLNQKDQNSYWDWRHQH